MTTRRRAIVFDLDDTLYPERRFVESAYRAVATWIAGRSAWKPDPKPFRIVLERLGCVSPSQAVYVADNPDKDFLGARRAGMDSIRVLRASGLHAHKPAASEAHRATAIVTDVGQIPTLLATWRWSGE